MRYLYISFLFCLIGGAVFPQTITDTVTAKNDKPHAPYRIVIRCHATEVDNQPLWIVNGVVTDTASVQKIDPMDIESINILKDATATALYGCRAVNGVIILTTKSVKLKQFSVKDSLDDNAIPGATLTFISLKNQKDSFRLIADGNGLVKTAALKKGEKYNVLISSVGYKTISVVYDPAMVTGIDQYRLTRDVKENQEAVVVSYLVCKLRPLCSHITHLTDSIKVEPEFKEAQILSGRVYPNPLQGGSAVKIEINMQNEKPLQVRITNLSGTVLRSVAHRSFKGVNRVEVPTASQWAAGMYFVQVLDEKGKLLKQNKLLIQ